MGTELGIIITDPKTASNADASFHGKAMSLMYSPGSNVAFPLVGAGAANTIGFDATNKTFIDIIFNDATFVPNQTPSFDQSYDFCKFFKRVDLASSRYVIEIEGGRRDMTYLRAFLFLFAKPYSLLLSM